MITRGRLTTDEVDRLVALADRDMTTGQIAQRLNRHPATVRYALLRAGALPPARPRERASDSRRRAFSPDEDAWIEEQRSAGRRLCEIARAYSQRFGFERKQHSIRQRLMMLANLPEAPL